MLDIGDTEEVIRKELNEPLSRIAAIGPAGENLVRIACVVNNKRHVCGRTGIGAVMGSKNLKAIVVKGSKKLNLFDKQFIIDKTKWFASNFKNNPDNKNLNLMGTSYYTLLNNETGILPTENFRTSWHNEADKISGETIREKISDRGEGCWGCSIRCKRYIKTGAHYYVDPAFGGLFFSIEKYTT